ncbi:MAG: LysE/ArgO family amino acid transporter [Micrococcales bacterium]
MHSFLPGVLTSLGLIMAIGAQNAYVLRQALKKQHVFAMVLFTAGSDALLIALGVFGLGALIQASPVLLEIMRWGGAAYLVWFGIQSIRNSTKHQSLESTGGKSEPLKVVMVTLAGFTYLNPHVYLDTVIFLGSIANTFGEHRWTFAYGAMLGSLIWFASLGFGAQAASKYLQSPKFWKWLDLSIALVMFGIAFTLLFARL